jgi:hypothetical protein
MAWIRDVVREPSLSPHWRWYAERKEVFLDGEGERFIDDPLTADGAWEQEVSQRDRSGYLHTNTYSLQSHLTGDQVQILLMMYSDKSNAA